jgi:hypothetical protein
MALSLVSAGVLTTEAGTFKNIVPVSTLSASAAVKKSGSWEFEVINGKTAKITNYTGKESYVLIPESVGGYTVKALKEGLFEDNQTITSVSIPRGVSEIPANTFRFCENLKTINIPHGVKSIGKEAFRFNTSLETIYLPSSLETIGEGTFYYCPKLKTVSMPSCKNIKSYAFSYCLALKSITLPSNLNYLADHVFENTDIESIKFTNRNANEFFPSAGAISSYSLTNVSVPNAEIFGVLIKRRSMKQCINLVNINESPLVTYRGSGVGYAPYIDPAYFEYIKRDFEKVDEDRIGFFEEWLEAEIADISLQNRYNCTTDAQKVKAIHDWVCNKVDYAWDENGNEDKSIYCHVDSSVFMRDTTVCDGYARAMKLLLDAAGIESHFTVSGTHAWVTVKLGDYYFHVDPCHDDTPDGIKYDHFLKSDSDIRDICDSHSTCTISDATNRNYPSSRIRDSRRGETISCSYSIGDANKDGVVNNADAELVLSVCANRREYNYVYDKLLADVDFDGSISFNDYYTLLDMISGS